MASARLQASAAGGDAAIQAAGAAVNGRSLWTTEQIRAAVPAAHSAAVALKSRSESTGWQVGRFTGLGISPFQNWLYERNRDWHFTDGTLCVLWCVEFPDANSDYAKNHRYVASTRRDYNRGEHHADAPPEPCVGYDQLGRPVDHGRRPAASLRNLSTPVSRAPSERHPQSVVGVSSRAVQRRAPRSSTETPRTASEGHAVGSLKDLLERLETGAHPACLSCVWRPSEDRRLAFGTSCIRHGLDWRSQDRAVSVQISQDPAGTTPERTGRLCAVCNSVNATDLSAQQGIALWRAGVLRNSDLDGGRAYLSCHYWTNAVMHGSSSRDELSSARASCAPVLAEQLARVTPRVIIACGKEAATSLNEAGILSQGWPVIRDVLRGEAYEEAAVFATVSCRVFVTYHTSARSVNQTAATFWSAETERRIESRLAQRLDAGEARRFLLRNPNSTTPGRGMRVLLVHWLAIGDAIRAAHSAV